LLAILGSGFVQAARTLTITIFLGLSQHFSIGPLKSLSQAVTAFHFLLHPFPTSSSLSLFLNFYHSTN
jgi:hypothetical protein